jgi:hypothetical protein
VLLGFNAGASTTTGSNNIYIDGDSLTPANESDTIRIGQTQTATFVQGIFGTSIVGGQPVVVDASGQLGSGAAFAGTSLNTPSTLVARDNTGSFAAQVVSVVDDIVSGHINIPVTTSLNVGTITQNNPQLIHTFGTNDTFVGFGAGNFTLTGANNTGVGAAVLDVVTTGANNTGLGNNALGGVTTGDNNTALGSLAMNTNSLGVNNVAVGNVALRLATTDNNTAVGSAALAAQTTGTENTALGSQAGITLTTGSDNVFIGFNTGALTTTGSNNIYVSGSGLTPTNESNFIRIGTTQPDLRIAQNVTLNNTTLNSGVGIQALQANTTGQRNTALGYNALLGNTTGDNNTAIGYLSLQTNTAGVNNAALGNGTLALSTTDNNTAVGSAALAAQTTGLENTAVGSQAGTAVTTGANNVMLGFNAGASTTTGSNNIYIDGDSLTPANESNFIRIGQTQTDVYIAGSVLLDSTLLNVGVGLQALQADTTGQRNTALGYNALLGNTTGDNNTAIGYLSLQTNTAGVNNVGLGNGTLALSTTDNNTAVGSAALASETTGDENTALGSQAGTAITTGSNNVMLGFNAGGSTTAGSNNIYIDGDSLTPADESDTIRIGQTQTATFIQGIFGATSVGAIPVVINAVGQLGTIVSAKKYKHDIINLTNESASIYDLNPVSFVYNEDETKTRQFGLIADEVDAVFPELVVKRDGEVFTVRYDVLPVLIVQEMKKLKNEVSQQQVAVSEHQQRLDEQGALIAQLMATVKDLVAKAA